MANKIKRKNDSFIRDALILCVITVILALLLAVVYNMTKKPIEKAAEEGKKVAYQSVFSGYENIDIKTDDNLTKSIESYQPADSGAKISEGVIVSDSEGNVIGRAFIASAKGYGGDVTVSVGIDNDGVITGIDIVSMNETAGLGANCTNDDFKSQYAGKSGEISVTKSEQPADNEISAISGATITSGAVTSAVNTCLSFAESLGDSEVMPNE